MMAVMTVLIDETRTARKVHRCIWCGETINPGDRYQYQYGKFEGEMQSNHWHLECLVMPYKEGLDATEGFTPYMGERGGRDE